MTVKVMTSPAVPAAAPVSEKPEARNTSPAEQPVKEPLVYLPAERGYEVPQIRLRRTSRRRQMTFGGSVLVQLAVSCAAAAALWAGLTFGGEEVKRVCVSIAELFR